MNKSELRRVKGIFHIAKQPTLLEHGKIELESY